MGEDDPDNDGGISSPQSNYSHNNDGELIWLYIPNYKMLGMFSDI